MRPVKLLKNCFFRKSALLFAILFIVLCTGCASKSLSTEISVETDDNVSYTASVSIDNRNWSDCSLDEQKEIVKRCIGAVPERNETEGYVLTGFGNSEKLFKYDSSSNSVIIRQKRYQM